MNARLVLASLALTTAAAVTFTSCAGEDQTGSPAHRMSVWVNGTNFGEDIGTLVADNARIAKVVPNGSGAVHAACGTLVTDAEMANTELPSPDPEVTDLLTKAYGLEGTVGNECYDAGSTNKSLLAQSARNAIKAEALYNEALQRIREIDGKVPETTTTVGNSGNSGGIFG
ncbi:MAG TPA: hypothetical protein VMP41_00855 [Acidimicrobiales bacterium]|nr:hypothetical protein [Acidimicrobiales bacterium]